MPNTAQTNVQFSPARTILDALTAHVAVLDEEGVILQVNAAWRDFARHNGVPLSDGFVGQNYLKICETAVQRGDQTAHLALQGIRRVASGEIEEFRQLNPCHLAGEKRWFIMNVTGLTEGATRKIVVCHENVTDIRLRPKRGDRRHGWAAVKDRLLWSGRHSRATAFGEARGVLGKALSALHKTFDTRAGSAISLATAALVYQKTDEGIMVTDAAGVIVAVNPAFVRITGYSVAEAVGQHGDMLKSDRHDAHFYDALWRDVAAKGHWEGDVWCQKKDKSVYLEWKTITKVPGSGEAPKYYVWLFNNVTKLWLNEEQLKHKAFHDDLTGLLNRFSMIERLERMIASGSDQTRRTAVLFLDLDGFKHVNDRLGHSSGDEVLRVVARRLLDAVRQSDMVARIGGDEFSIVLTERVDQDEVASIAARIITVVGETIGLGGESAKVGVSIGIAIHPEDAGSALALLNSADFAMYAAKAAGKNRFCFYSEIKS